MGVNELLVFGFAAALISAIVLLAWWRRELRRVRELSEERVETQRRLEASRAEVGAIKEEARKRRSELAELRDQVRKLKRKRKGGSERDDEGDPREREELAKVREEVKRLTAALEGAESRVRRVQESSDEALRAARDEARAEAERNASRRVASLEEEIAALTAERDKPAEEAPRPARGPAPAGVRIDLASLPEEAVAELHRFYKKSSNFEKLYLVANGKLEVLNEKHEELTRRYYAVCRELALAAGKPLGEGAEGDEQAARVAQEVVASADEVARKRRRRPRARRSKRSPPKPDAEAADGAAAEGTTEAEAPADAGAAPELSSSAPAEDEGGRSVNDGTAEGGELEEEASAAQPSGSP